VLSLARYIAFISQDVITATVAGCTKG